ncbi:hypothetical protein [Pseudogemmobacter bohemicus]|uniref:hypothetical protein n=1 Tax=Pseudogemmobacter bohemicus TaxID=2250708 RepID=UPI0013008171|nr:hypothetical protein [Pseudogemmobacter bohemicus]
MRIVPGLFAVFWRSPGSSQQFHADVGARSPHQAAVEFRRLFPGDIVVSVRGVDGRFEAFT